MKRQQRQKDVSETEMIRTGDSNIFKGGPAKPQKDTDPVDETEFAQPKGIQTRAAIANHLAKKLKIANQDLATLQSFEKVIKANENLQDTFWE